MTDTLIMMATLVVAIFWIGLQQRRLTVTRNRLRKVEKRLHSARLTLTQTKGTNEELGAETMLLKTVITDVAKGEAHVWIGEDGEVVAARTAVGEIQIH